MGAERSTEQALTVVIRATSDDYAPTDPRWRSEVRSLVRLLDQQVLVDQRITSTEGTKSGVVELIAILGSAGALSAALQAFKAWLQRDRSRRLTLTWDLGGQSGRIDLNAENASEEGARQVLSAALDKLAGRDG